MPNFLLIVSEVVKKIKSSDFLFSLGFSDTHSTLVCSGALSETDEKIEFQLFKKFTLLIFVAFLFSCGGEIGDTSDMEKEEEIISTSTVAFEDGTVLELEGVLETISTHNSTFTVERFGLTDLVVNGDENEVTVNTDLMNLEISGDGNTFTFADGVKVWRCWLVGNDNRFVGEGVEIGCFRWGS
jgi:hypothetical protein